MTHEEFNRLYVAGEDDGTEKTVEAFTYNGKFYLRIHSVRRHLMAGYRSTPFGRKKYTATRESHFIKEFDTRETANAYFAKISSHFVQIR